MTGRARMSSVASAKQTGTDVTEEPLTRSVRRLLTWRSGIDGRLVLFGAVAAYLAAVVVGRLVWQVDVWAFLGIPPGPSVFFDARNLTAAWECQRLGYDPLYESPCDPWNRPLMYLRPWLFLGVLGTRPVAHVPARHCSDCRDVPYVRAAGRTSSVRNGSRAGARGLLARSDVGRRTSEHGHRAVLVGGDVASAVAECFRAGPGL